MKRGLIQFWAMTALRGLIVLACTSFIVVRAAPVEPGSAPVLAHPPRLLAIGKRVADVDLATRRGGTDTRSDASLQATVSGNQAVNVTTGTNNIGGGALAGAAGIPVVVQNSGNNVLIQTSVIVNLQLK